MTDDTRIVHLLRSAVPPIVTTEPSPDMWQRIVKRSRDSQPWSWVDIGLAAAVAIALVMRPDLLMLLAYHL